MVVTATQYWGKCYRVLDFDFESGCGESLGGPLIKEMARSYLGGMSRISLVGEGKEQRIPE